MNTYSHKFFTSLCFGNDINLMDSCILPDEDEAQSGYSCHFYNPVTRKCYLGTEDSAKNRFIWHLSNYLITKEQESLGRAIHYLEDICTPVHTQYEDPVDAAIRLNLHINFEKRLDEYLENQSQIYSKLNATPLSEVLEYYKDPVDNAIKLNLHINSEKRSQFYSKLNVTSLSEVLEYCPCKASELYYQCRYSGITTKVFDDVCELVVSSLLILKSCIYLNKIVSKTFTIKKEKINILFERGKILPSCLNTNFCLRYNGIDNVSVYHRESRMLNFNFLTNLI